MSGTGKIKPRAPHKIIKQKNKNEKTKKIKTKKQKKTINKTKMKNNLNYIY